MNPWSKWSGFPVRRWATRILRLLLAGGAVAWVAAGHPASATEGHLAAGGDPAVGSGLGGAGHPPVKLEIRYAEGPAEEVVLVWGINGWLQPPVEGWPAGSAIRRRVLHSPMLPDGGAHRVVIEVPQGSQVDYGFLVTPPGDSVASPIWRESPTGEPLVAERDRVIVHGPVRPAQPEWLRWLWVGGAVACLLVSWRRRCRPLSRSAFLDIDPSPVGVAKVSAGLALAVVAVLLGAWAFARVGLAAGGTVPGGIRAGLALFDPWIETGLPAWFSAALMVLAAVTCIGCFLLDQARGTGRFGRLLCWGWLAMAAGFLMMSGSSPGSWGDAGSAGFSRLGWPGKVVAVAALLVLLLFGGHLRRDRLPALLTLFGAGCFIAPLGVASVAVDAGGELAFRQVLIGRWGEMAGSLAFAVAAMTYLSRGGGFRVHFELASGWTFVVVVAGAFVLAWIAVHGGIPGVGIPVTQAWFPATLAAVAAVASYYLHRGFRTLGEAGRARVYAGWAVVAVALSMTCGVGLRSWVAGSGLEATVDATLALILIMAAVAGCGVVARPGYGLGAAVWLVAAGELLRPGPDASGWGLLVLAAGMWGMLVPPVVQLAISMQEAEDAEGTLRLVRRRIRRAAS